MHSKNVPWVHAEVGLAFALGPGSDLLALSIGLEMGLPTGSQSQGLGEGEIVVHRWRR